MGVKEIRFCDMTQEDGAQNWEFEEGDKKYGIDLLESEWDKLNKLFKDRDAVQAQIQEYVDVAEDRTPGQPTLTGKAPKKDTGPDATDVRKWATEGGELIDGKPIPERGRVPQVWKDAYKAAKEKEALQRTFPQTVADSSGQEQPAGEASAADSTADIDTQ